jgi:hypothetical protein
MAIMAADLEMLMPFCRPWRKQRLSAQISFIYGINTLTVPCARDKNLMFQNHNLPVLDHHNA